jgi:hypothetical protein
MRESEATSERRGDLKRRRHKRERVRRVLQASGRIELFVRETETELLKNPARCSIVGMVTGEE